MKLSPKQEAKPTPRLECFTRAETNLQTPRGLRITTFASDSTYHVIECNIGDGNLDLNYYLKKRKKMMTNIAHALVSGLGDAVGSYENWSPLRRNARSGLELPEQGRQRRGC
jgi:hypothetical protein